MSKGFSCGECQELIQGKEPLPKWWYCKKYFKFLEVQPKAYHETATRTYKCVYDENGI